MTKFYKTHFEINVDVYFNHPFVIVEAHNMSEAVERAIQVFNSHPDNVRLNWIITKVEMTKPREYEHIVYLSEKMPYQPKKM